VRDEGVKIGLEVHVQLTCLRTKLFCHCSSDYRGRPPNTHVCPICLGLPGTLPVLNERAVQAAVKIAMALNAKIAERTVFYRKNYFYPDMPKNFQISQFDRAGGVPLAVDGHVDFAGKRVRIRRIQLEEDPGKLSYEGTIDTAAATLVDYNRAGIGLVEIVTEPDLSDPREARNFLQKMRSIMEHLGVCEGDLEGAMRCDANISLAGGVRVEIKNISSFKEVERALRFEITRQGGLLKRGVRVAQETRHWDEARRITISLRVKEAEHDYRYFPEPDLVPVAIKAEALARLKGEMPELPDARKERFVGDHGLSELNAEVLVSDKALADFFEEALKAHLRPREISNWIVGDLLGYLNEEGIELGESKITPKHVARMVQLIEEGAISGKIGKMILQEMITTGKAPDELVEEKGLRVIASKAQLEELVDKVFSEHGDAVEDALRDERAVHYLVGQLMKETGGKAEPELANRAIRERLAAVAAGRR